MKKILILILSVLAAVGIALAATTAQAHGPGSMSVGFLSNPRFPIVGQPAELTFRLSFNDDTPKEGQSPMVMVAWTKSGGHAHGPEGEGEAAPAAGGHDMANMGGTPAEVPDTVHLMPVEISPGVYAANITFEQGGRYVATVAAAEDEVDVIIGVRSAPIAWWFVGGLAGLSVLMAAMVAVVKTVRRTW